MVRSDVNSLICAIEAAAERQVDERRGRNSLHGISESKIHEARIRHRVDEANQRRRIGRDYGYIRAATACRDRRSGGTKEEKTRKTHLLLRLKMLMNTWLLTLFEQNSAH